MALTPEQIEDIATDWFSDEWAVARAIKLIEQVEAEVRKKDDALIQQLVEAIEAETSDTWECNSYHPKLHDAVVAARARLGEKT